MAKKRTREEIEAGTTKFTEVVRAISKVINQGILWVGIVFCVYFIANGLAAYAGKTSSANMFFSVITDLRANEWFGLLFGGGGVGYGLLQRNAKKKVIREKSERINLLERQIDTGKQTSALTPEGESNRDD